jgi:hypothetical protein
MVDSPQLSSQLTQLALQLPLFQFQLLHFRAPLFRIVGQGEGPSLYFGEFLPDLISIVGKVLILVEGLAAGKDLVFDLPRYGVDFALKLVSFCQFGWTEGTVLHSAIAN